MSKRSAITVHSSSLTVFAVALTMRIWHLIDIRQAPFFPMRLGDSLSYHNWALEVAQGNWIGTEVFYQAPLYPYCLAVIYWLFGSSRLTVVLIQSILGSVACVLLADTTARLISRRAAFAAGLLLACYPTAIFFDSLIQKSTLGLFLLCLMVRLLTAWTQQHSRKAAFLTGVTTGLLVLTRENAIVFLLGIVLAGAFMQRRRRRTAL
jgi:4-amino-4-deoxy-L-arabinose transferase-like glycosyltransferase